MWGINFPIDHAKLSAVLRSCLGSKECHRHNEVLRRQLRDARREPRTAAKTEVSWVTCTGLLVEQERLVKESQHLFEQRNMGPGVAAEAAPTAAAGKLRQRHGLWLCECASREPTSIRPQGFPHGATWMSLFGTPARKSGWSVPVRVQLGKCKDI